MRVHSGSRSWLVLGLAGATWVAAVGGRWHGWVALAFPVALGLASVVARRGRRVVAMASLLALAGFWSGFGSAQREEAILRYPTSEGPITSQVRLLDDPREGDFGWWALGVMEPPEQDRPPAVPLLLSFDDHPSGLAGERIRVEGRRIARSGTARGDPYSGVVSVEDSFVVDRGEVWWRVGNSVRSRALERLRGGDPARALLAGFLVGDTSRLPEADMEAMRRTGLTHLVAVSGSNVSLFLMLTLVAAGPIAAGPRRRAVVGLAAVAVLVIATRWEPSVVRAAVMAGLVLAGRVGGWALDAATALGVTVMTVLVVAGEYATDVGFTLSVLATAGVLAGGALQLRHLPSSVATALSATLGAQVAVAPVLLAVFGRIPLLSPLANLVAIPVVGVTTAVGAVAVAVGWEWAIELAALGGRLVLAVARNGAVWPQVAWTGFGLFLAGAVLAIHRRLRPLLAVAAAVAVAAMLVGTGRTVPVPSAVVLDVGQGDAILVQAEGRRTLLVDGGPDPTRLEEKLLTYEVEAIDLVVLTHVHADHAAGLEAVVGRRPIGEMWIPTPPHETPASVRLLTQASAHGVAMRTPPVGSSVPFGNLTIEVLGPLRRYASPNDQSTVLRIHAPGGPALLLTGDVETHAQADLVGVQGDILKVPHQGAATSDLEWLRRVGAREAVVSVGPNDFGHPDPGVIAVLEESGATVHRTDLNGDVVLPLALR